MKKIILLLVVAAVLSPVLWAQQPSPKNAEVASTWHGVDFRVYHVERIAGNRLLFGVELVATPKAPPGGTFIAVHDPPPPKSVNSSVVVVVPVRKEGPFSLDTAVMTDELTGKTYPVVPPNPTGPHYLPGEIFGMLRPNEVEQMTIQFLCPPPDPQGRSVNQTVSLLLPNAKGPLVHIEIPPPAPAH